MLDAEENTERPKTWSLAQGHTQPSTLLSLECISRSIWHPWGASLVLTAHDSCWDPAIVLKSQPRGRRWKGCSLLQDYCLPLSVTPPCAELSDVATPAPGRLGSVVSGPGHRDFPERRGGDVLIGTSQAPRGSSCDHTLGKRWWFGGQWRQGEAGL